MPKSTPVEFVRQDHELVPLDSLKRFNPADYYIDAHGNAVSRASLQPITPPSQWYRYTAAADFWIEMTPVTKGTVVGVGTVDRDAPCQLCKLELAEGFPFPGFAVGHVRARLETGVIKAERIAKPD